jgi:putative endonuclease
MKSNNKIIGNAGEEFVTSYLKNQQYTILERQFTINPKIGEIDIIAKKNNIYAFVEVKTRKTNHAINILQIVSRKKQNAIIKMALLFLQKNNILISEFIIRFDIAYVLENKLEYYQNAFTIE